MIGCNNSKKVKSEIVEEQNQEYSPINKDTIQERNNPNSLDLTKNQLFIDTTRESFIYKLANWKPSKDDDLTAKAYFDIFKGFSKPKKVDLGDFPKFFTRINKLEDLFLLYDRCDGGDPRYELRDSAVVFHGPLETYAETINEVIQSNSKRINLNLNTIENISTSKVSNLEIYESEFSGVYILKRKIQDRIREEYVIPINEVYKYDLVINHCPEGKVFEYEPIIRNYF